VDRRVRQQGDVARPLNGQRQLPLMLGAIARDTPGDDFPAFSDEIPQGSHILIVYLQSAVGTKTADFAPMESTSLASHNHGLSPYDKMA
jgi:hypothetical protein